MKKSLLMLLVAPLVLMISCQHPFEAASNQAEPEQQLGLDQTDQARAALLVVSPNCLPRLDFGKVVFIGDSLTAGIQSDGLSADTQVFSYPAQIARQLGTTGFEQPLVGFPGISTEPGQGALTFNPATGDIYRRGTYTDPFALLQNALLPRPYDNLGVPGARLGDLLRTVDGSGGNPFFDLILRNTALNLGPQVEQLKALEPTLAVVWAGNNDVLLAATAGGDPTLITPVNQFRRDFSRLMREIKGIPDIDIIVVNIPDIADIPFVNALDDRIFVHLPRIGRVPVVFDASFTPIDFDPAPNVELYIPLLTDEGRARNGKDRIKHVLLPFVAAYRDTGLGIPSRSDIETYLIQNVGLQPDAAVALSHGIVGGMLAGGLSPSGTAIPGTLSITRLEEWRLKATTMAYNRVIAQIAHRRRQAIPVVSSRRLLGRLAGEGVEGFSGQFVWFDPVNTAFSLDGVHPNNAGHGIVANALIRVFNLLAPEEEIPYIDLEQFRGQYIGTAVTPAGSL